MLWVKKTVFREMLQVAFLGIIFWGYSYLLQAQPVVAVKNKGIEIQFNGNLYTQVIPKSGVRLPLMASYSPSEALLTPAGLIDRFAFQEVIYRGDTVIIRGTFQKNAIIVEKKVVVIKNPQYPNFLFLEVEYKNTGSVPLQIAGWQQHAYQLQPSGDHPPFWSYQSGSYEERYDWITPVTPGFFRENYMGMNASDYGGGTPVVDVWRRDVGIAIGHIDIFPRLVSLPVDFRDSATVKIAIIKRQSFILSPGASIKTLPTFVAVHKGDFFTTLQRYRQILESRGLRFAQGKASAYEPIWCAWGYERNFSVAQILKTLPEVKKLGLKWVVIDDGWQVAEGEWIPNPQKFPRGDKDMKALVDRIHAAGLKAKLWWVPLAMDSGSALYQHYPDFLLHDEDGSPRLITWWDSYYLCPAYPPVKQYTAQLVKKFIQDWGFDGLKIDGQHLNGVPPCYNPAHHHTYPQESVEQLPQFFQQIYQIATAIKPDAVIEICACGTAASVYNMAAMNQPVASDPLNSWQVRHRAKVYKALMGVSVAYYGDHVELSDGFQDFASTVGVGGVIGTKFTLPEWGSDTVRLSPERERKWRAWIEIYNKYQLSRGRYRGELYDIGYDRPETHVIQKSDTLFYAFYAPDFTGELEFRGLQQGYTYRVIDYVHHRSLGTVSFDKPRLSVTFQRALLVYAVPQ